MRPVAGTSATAVADIVGVMTTNPSPGASCPPAFWERGLRGFVAILQTVVLPHLAAGLGLFAVTSYATYVTLLAPLHLPSLLFWLILGCFLCIYGMISFGYALLAACLYALRLACVAWDDFIGQMIDKVKDQMVASLQGVQDGLAKDQAKVLVRGSVREVFAQARRQPVSWPKWVELVFLGALLLAIRSVLVARIVKFSGATIKLSKIFAGKATLVGAVFLNLRFFSTVLLALVYAWGAGMLLVQVLWVCAR